jgi:hypothetical protein
MNGQQELKDALQNVVRPSQNYYDEILAMCKTYFIGLRLLKHFTSEDVAFHFENHTGKKPAEPRVYGAVIKALQSEGKIRHVGYTKATNKQAHCRPISVWEMV